MSSDLSDLEIAGGSVVGRAHVLTGRNNQDAFAWTRSPRGLVAIVADGCSSGAHSELGAKLGARGLTGILQRRLDAEGDAADPCFWQEAQAELLGQVAIWSSILGGHRTETLTEACLFTVVGLLITPQTTWFFSVGDGLAVINGVQHRSGPFPNNAPPYLAYGLLERVEGPISIDLKPTLSLPTDHLQHALLGTDGTFELGNEASVRSFWEDDLCFRNADVVRRRLTQHNLRSVQAGGSALQDDTTVVVIRRASGAGQA